MAVGTVGQVTITTADVAQPLKTVTTLVRSFVVMPDSANTGDFLVSYGGTPLLPAIEQAAIPGLWYDLAMVQIQSTVAGDKANFNAIYKP